MKFGANTFIWESPLSNETLTIADRVSDMGCEVFEMAVEDPNLLDLEVMETVLARTRLIPIICGVFGPGRNLSSAEAAARDEASSYLRWCIDTAAALGAPLVAGPMYSAVGKLPDPDPTVRAAEWSRAVEGLQTMAAYAGEQGVKLAFEPLNRFETGMINTVAQGLRLIEEVGSPHLGLHLDTFHMHLEEKDSAEAIRRAGDRLFHLHACENDRGVPGTGQVDWDGVAAALHDINYRGAVVIESFTPKVTSIARAVCIWREIAPSQDAIAVEGLAFLRKLLGSNI